MTLTINKELKKSLKNRTLLLANWGCGDKNTFQCRDWIPIFRKYFKKTIVFSLRNHYYFYGKPSLNKKFLEILKKEKPDYLIFGHRYDEIEINTLMKIKEVSPKTKTIIEFGDDDFRFDDWGRYYSLFFDYVVTPKKELDIYKKDKIKNVFFMIAINPDFYKPLNLEKKYDVTFIGRPVADRYGYIKYLLDKGVNIKLFGVAWENYPDLKDIYQGILYGDDFVKVMNQSKINLNFSKTLYEEGKKGQLKGRVLEVAACNSFLLTEYSERNFEIINKTPEINFKTKKELLEKISYYLKHDKEREKISKKIYDFILKNHTWDVFIENFFNKVEKDIPGKIALPNVNKRIVSISKKEITLPMAKLIEELKDADYICFSDNKSKNLPYRNYFQAYSLFISKKKISCCDYIVYSDSIGDYLIFKAKNAFNTLKRNEFSKLLNINEIMVEKNFFLENLKSFIKLFNKESAEIITNDNTVFISIPLIKTKEIPSTNYKTINSFFYMLFFDKLVSKIYQKKFFSSYIFQLSLFALTKRIFILRYLFERLLDSANMNALKTFKSR